MTPTSWEKEASYIKGFAKGSGMTQTLYALSLAKEHHDGQMRKGGGPYIQHPIRVCSHLMSLGIKDDSILAAALLHDIVEDTDMSLTVLERQGISHEGVVYIDRLSKKKSMSTDKYYQDLSDSAAGLVKLSDRCNNVSTMAGAFSQTKIVEYIAETEEYVLPMAKELKAIVPHYADAIFAMRYHIESILSAYKSTLLTSALSGDDNIGIS